MVRTGIVIVVVWSAVGCGEVKVDQHTDAPGPIDAPDTMAPVVTITQKPAALATPTATFEWAVDDVSATFQCSLDSASFTVCTSPTTFNNLAPGNHMFQVLARDAAGNTGMASHSWAVEPPCTPSLIEMESITPTPTNWAIYSGSVLHGGSGLTATAAGATLSFQFTGKGLTLFADTGPNIHTSSWTIDGGTPVAVDEVNSGFLFQIAFPITSGLVNKVHTVNVVCTQANCSPDYVSVTCQ
jgi:hypothetical protein